MTNYVPRINLSGNEIWGGGTLYIERFYQNYLYYTITHLRRPAVSYHHSPCVDPFPGLSIENGEWGGMSNARKKNCDILAIG